MGGPNGPSVRLLTPSIAKKAVTRLQASWSLGSRIDILDHTHTLGVASYIYEEIKIILLYIPPHSSHLLQPLNVGYFSPLKSAYSDAILVLAHNRIYYISNETFLLAFKKAYYKSIILENIYRGF